MNELPQRSAPSHPDPVAQVDVDISPRLIDERSRESIRLSLSGSLRQLANLLGVPGSVEARLHTGDGVVRADRPIVVRVNGHRVHYSSELAVQLAQYCGSDIERIHADPRRLTEFLPLLARHVVQLQPSLLLGPAQLAAYRDALCASGHRSESESPYLEGALKLALRLWLSIGNVDAIAEAVGAVPHADAVQTQEAVIQALRPDRIEIHVPLGYLRLMTESADEWTGGFSLLRSALALELGVRVPPFRFVLDEELNRPDESPQSFRFRINALTTPPIRGLAGDELLVNDTRERLAERGVAAVGAVNWASGLPAAIVNRAQRPQLEPSRYVTWDAQEYLVLCLAEAIRSRAALLIDQGTADELLTTLRWQAPRLRDVIDALYSPADVATLLRELLADRISIRNISRVCNLLADADREPSFDERVSFVRAGMREIGSRLSRAHNVVPVYLLDLSIVDALENARASGLDETTRNAIVDAVQSELNHLPDITPPAILATAKSRALLQSAMRDPFPRVAVTTLDELSDELAIQPIARISI